MVIITHKCQQHQRSVQSVAMLEMLVLILVHMIAHPLPTIQTGNQLNYLQLN